MHEEFSRGSTIAGRFRLDSRVGQGGMGQVFRGEDLDSGRPVAVKFLSTSEEGFRDRFAREAQTLASLVHPAIVGYVAHGTTEHGSPFLAMDWLEGSDLAAVLRAGPLSVAATLSLVRRVAAALVVAHGSGIVHRDLKPGNIVLVGGLATGATVVDFGIARPDAALQAITRTGAIVGTCGYMAPEQVRGVRDLDGRADLFSLGCVAFECLTGRPPFGADAFASVLARVLLGSAPRVREFAPGVSSDVEAVVARLLERERDARYACASSVVDAIDALEGDGVSATAPTVAARPSLRPRLQVERLPAAVVLAWPPSATPTSDDTVSADDVSTGTAAATALAKSWGGECVPLVGGLVLLAFAQHTALQERVRRAARAALELHAGLPGWGVAVALSMEGSGVGAPSERAAALVGVPAGSSGEQASLGVVVDPSVVAFLGSEFVLETTNATTYLTAHRSERDEVRKVLGRTSPCFGRDKELRFIEGTLHECIDEGAARVLVLAAAPGIGKSRIRREFAARVAERGDACLLTARAEVGSANASLHIVRAWLAEGLGLRGRSPSERWERVARVGRETLARAVGDDAADAMVEFLGELADAPPLAPGSSLVDARTNARDMRQQLQAALRGWLRGLAMDRPLVLVLEDLHWADPTSVSLLASVLPAVDDVPLLLVATSWPEGEHSYPALWSLRMAQVVRIEPLGRRASERLARQLLGEASDPLVVQRVAELADGSPFLLEEIARHAGEGRSLENLPSSAVAVVQSRLVALPTELRRVLRLASVFGERFEPAGVDALGVESGDTGGVSSALDRLRREELVLSPDDERDGGTAWGFRHSLVRRAAYELLVEEDRLEAHRAAAAWLATQQATDPAVIAEHHEHARDYEAAASWFLRAVDAQGELGDYQALAKLAERADRPEVSFEIRAEALYHAMFANAYLERFESVGAVFARVDSDEFPRDSAAWAALKAASIALKIHGGIPCDPSAELEEFFACSAQMSPSVSRVFVMCLLVVSLMHVGLLEESERIARMVEAMTADPATEGIMWALRDAYLPWLRAMQDDVSSLAAHRRAVRFAIEKCNAARQLEIVPPYISFAMDLALEKEARELEEFVRGRRAQVGIPFDDFALLGTITINVFGSNPRDCRDLLAQQMNPEWKHVDLWIRAYAAASPSIADPASETLALASRAELLALAEECGPMQSHRASALLLAAECSLRVSDHAQALALLERLNDKMLLIGARTRFDLACVKALRGLGRRGEAEDRLMRARARLERLANAVSGDDRIAIEQVGAARELRAFSS